MVCKGEIKLFNCIRILEKWCKDFDLEINYEKSAILKVRADRRTPGLPSNLIRKFPVKTQYTYLGVEIDDCLNFRPLTKKFKSKLKTFKSQLTMCWANKLDQNTKY